MSRRSLDPRTLAVTAVMTAIVFVLTSIVRVPTPAKGYIHLGDAGVFFTALAFGPWIGAAAGGLGTALADVGGGYLQWAPFSLLIHGLEGWVVGWISRRWPGVAGLVLSVAAGAIIVVAGYFVAGVFLSGVGAAVGELPLNVLQVIGGGVLGTVLFVLVRQAYPPITRFGRQRD
jgi:uncharacterized membrane protein